MWLGNMLGRFWAWSLGARRLGSACDDDCVQLCLVSRLIPRWAIGQAWGDFILLREDWWERPATKELLLHEYRHVIQWRRFGSAFIPLYVAGWLWAGMRYGPGKAYWMNWMERQARGEL